MLVRQEQAPPTLIVWMRWRAGSVRATSGSVVVSATKFTYRRWRDMPLVALFGWRLRSAWGERPGAVGLVTGGEPHKRVTYSLSVWQSRADLKRFLVAPEHLALVRRFRPRLSASKSVVWETADFSLAEAWEEAMRRLAAA